MARYTSGKQGVIPRYDIASILVFNERIYEYGDKVKWLILWKSVVSSLNFDGKVYKWSLIRWEKRR